MIKKQVDIITMGCSKNLVDSEKLMGLMERHGYKCVHDSEDPQGEIVVVNTCGFINDAKEESINMILQMAQLKAEGLIRKLYVMGCLSERYLADLEKELPEVDGYYGKFNYLKLLGDLDKLDNIDSIENLERVESQTDRKLTTPSHYAYIKISEGCDRHCAYCAIPLITGRHRSRPQEDILNEVRQLVKRGVSEFQVIAQELTYYGVDLDGNQQIAELIERMADIEGVRWIRLHYAYPAHFPWELLRVIRERNNVCCYLDIALQHISDNMLTAMRRHVTKEETYELIRRMREEVPGINIRTTLMVGFPGETEDDFKELLEFTRWARFERMGAFAYSAEEGTWSGDKLKDDVPEEVKQERLSRLMRLQQRISEEKSAELVGKVLTIVVDRQEGEYFVGRSEYSSPEVDPEVLVKEAENLEIGKYYTVKIIGSEEFDLYATTEI
ncbi:MAG: 30S ribosomal protein S12 methylthiotransferase RimO [Prevotella sp.]|nr:30S ribosomal protein S12 methylthiotransferase RimO [Prevotella sp.]